MITIVISDILLFGSNEGTAHLPEGLAKALMGFHSGWRYIILILMILGIWFGYQSSKGKRPFAGATKKLGLFSIIAMDIQLVVGLILYYYWLASQTNFRIAKLTDQLGVSQFRSITLDHAIGMFLALIFVHIGYAKAKKALSDTAAGKKQFVWFLIALIIIIVSIPWPFMHPTRGWV